MKKTVPKWVLFVFILFGYVAAWAQDPIALVPRPVEMTTKPGIFTLARDTVIAADQAFREAGLDRALAATLGPATGYDLGFGASGSTVIALAQIAPGEPLGNEGYRLSVTTQQITIEAPTAAGAFYGIQTLRQLLPPAIFATTPQDGVSWTAPCVEIIDYPRFAWRGMHLDVARHFFDVDYVKRYIDLLALHKMNTFHWHLSDDDAWRLEIKRYPALTAEGSSRSRTIDYGQPTFYTQDEIRDVVRYAAARYVHIVPEIDMPGHQKAGVTVYPEWGARDDAGRLGNVLNIRDETVAAMKNIIGEVIDLFPGPYIHCGGDEVRASWVWQKDPASAAKAERLGLKDAHEIQTWLSNELEAFVASKGRRMVGWDEVVHEHLHSNTVIMAWRGDGARGHAAAKMGFDVVMAPTRFTYFDYRPAPQELGFSRQVVSLATVYAFDPAPSQDLTKEEAQHILGAQGQLWSELMPDEDRVDYMAYPRGSALAEAVWTPQADRSYADFWDRLMVHVQRLDALGTQYRLNTEVVVDEQDDHYLLSAPLGGGPIHYTIDGSEPGPESAIFTAPIPDTSQLLKARVIRADGRMAPVVSRPGISSLQLRAENALLEGRMRVESLQPGETNIGGWRRPYTKADWRMRVEEPGRYRIRGRFSGPTPLNMKIDVGETPVRFSIPATKTWTDPVTVDMGTVELTGPDIYPVTLSVITWRGFKGVNMWGIEFERAPDE